MKILIVEDEAITAVLMKMDMESKGYYVLGPVASGEEAVKIAEKDKPDIILMDISLFGEIDGIETAKIIFEKKKVPIIFTTGYNEDDIIDRAMKLQPLAYLVKPVNLDEIDNLIHSSFSKKTKKYT